MTDRSQAKPFEQDVLGILFCALGGFVAVSIVLAWMGQEPKGDLWSLPIQSLVAALGPFAALLFSVGLAGLGTMLFLRATSMPSLRLLLGLSAAAIGLSLLAGILGAGGGLGAVFPGLLTGGEVLAGVLGLAVLWLGLVLASPGARQATGAEVVQRVGLTTRSESREASVSAAEAALLTREASSARSGSLGVVTPLPRGAASPARPGGVRPVSESPTRRVEEPSVRPLTPAAPVRPLAAAVAAPLAEQDVTSSTEAPPAPSWEQEESEDPFSGIAVPLEEAVTEDEELVDEIEESDEVEEEELDEAAELEDEAGSDESDESDEEAEEDDELVAEDDTDESDDEEYEDESDEEEDLEEEDLEEAAELEDEESEEEEQESEEDEEALEEEEGAEEELPLAAQALLDAAAAETEEAPVTAAPARASWEQIGLFDEAEEPASSAAPVRSAPRPRKTPASPAKPADPSFTLEPAARATSTEEPAKAGPKDWSRLVHQAGCLFLDENRVAVSMLQRRFSIEFDEACRVLDELQEAGLIGPYMGGRTRDILLTRDEWLAQAPRVS